MPIESSIAANRFGLGARPGELERIGRDSHDWLLAQVRGSRPVPDVLKSLPSSATIFEAYTEGREDKRDAKAQAAATPPSAAPQPAAKIAANVRQKIVPMYLDQVAARYRLAVQTDEPFRERLVHFWANHFAVSADKAQVVGLAGALENEAIRPHLGGRFVDLLLAVESHPAMILYLDNQRSIGPDSTAAQAAARSPRPNRLQSGERKAGINENLAREILELHTLGVDGGYTQADVTAFAKALTGWSIGGNALFGMVSRFRGNDPTAATRGLPGEFAFHEALHEPGAKAVLGKRYAEEGIAQPRAMLHDFAKHPATATHIATKLARHFIADDPPRAAVERIAKAFRASDGDLPTVHRALIEAPASWREPLAKFKTPHDFVISTFRMFDFKPPGAQQVANPFQTLGQRPYTPGSPAGWPDTASAWDGPDALLRRIEWSGAIAKRFASTAQPLELASTSLGDVLSERTRTAIARAASAAQGLALLLASPEFQRR